MLRPLVVLSLLIIMPSDATGQVSRWTPFQGHSEESLPAERYGSTYGFSVKQGTTIISDRFWYPTTDPHLFEGDRIVSIKGGEVTDEASILAALDAIKKMPASAVVERKNRDGSVRKLTVKIYRSEFAAAKQLMESGELRLPLRIPERAVLPSLEVDSFGWLYTDAEFVAWVDDPERFTAEKIPVFRAKPLRVNGNRRMSAKEVSFLEKIGLFIIRDFREGNANIDFYTDIVVSRFPKERWVKGEAIYVEKGQFLVEPDLTVTIDGKETSVKVLTRFIDRFSNEIPQPLP